MASGHVYSRALKTQTRVCCKMATGLFLSRFSFSCFSSASHSIRAELEKRGVKFTNGITSLKVTPCPHCTKHGTHSTSLFIQPDGRWACNPCKKSGSTTDTLSQRPLFNPLGTKEDLFPFEAKVQGTEAKKALESIHMNKPTNVTVKPPLKMTTINKLNNATATLTPKELKLSKDTDTLNDASSPTLPDPPESQKRSSVPLPINDKVKKLFDIEVRWYYIVSC